MADVARRAGVSVSTVSHVMNGTRPVAEATRDAVLSAIQETGYTPNSIARSLATASTRSIGLAMSAISNPYFTNLVHAIEQELSDSGYMPLLADPHEDPARELQIVRGLHERRVDGLFVAPGPDSPRHTLPYLARYQVPTVLVDRLASADFDQVGVENVEATATLVSHLVENGHRTIAMISGLPGLSTTEERIAGYRLGLERAGLVSLTELIQSGASDAHHAREAVHRLWAMDGPPSALVVGNNQMTIGAIRGLRDLSLQVPTDAAVVSFDDFEWADLFHPRLTAMSQPVDVIAAEAVRLLIRRISSPSLPPQTIRLSPSFMHRESCGCPGDPEHGAGTAADPATAGI